MRVVLIDGANLAYRAQYTAGYLRTQKGTKTGVIHSFIKMLDSLYRRFDAVPILTMWEGGVLAIKREGKSYVVDDKDRIPNWRTKLPRQDYKGQRKITQDTIDVHNQIPHVQRVLSYLKHPQFSVPGLEGDDLIGIAAYRLSLRTNIEEVAIVSSDKDFFQCISDNVNVYRPGKGNLVKYNRKAVFQEFNVYPDQWAAYKAFTGDSSDHYKGMEDVGPKTAAELMAYNANPARPWHQQNSTVREKFNKLKDKWQQAEDAYKLSLIPTTVEYSLFSAESRKLARVEFDNFEAKLHRRFTSRELEEAMSKLVSFCGRFELLDILGNKRKYFVGSIVDGERLT